VPVPANPDFFALERKARLATKKGKKGSVRHLDIFKENAFHHEGHEGHEKVAMRFIAHRVTEEGMQS